MGSVTGRDGKARSFLKGPIYERLQVPAKAGTLVTINSQEPEPPLDPNASRQLTIICTHAHTVVVIILMLIIMLENKNVDTLTFYADLQQSCDLHL